MTSISLSKRGYGTLEQIEALDTPEFLDIVEYEMISSAIEDYELEKVKNGSCK
jgi:hypothetical protein